MGSMPACDRGDALALTLSVGQTKGSRSGFGRNHGREEFVALVVLLRGVNVGGHRTFHSTELAKQLSDLDVVNIGAAGTFVVREPVTQARLRAELTSRLPSGYSQCIRRSVLRPAAFARG
jgi:Protein of unknown function (DUF1697)